MASNTQKKLTSNLPKYFVLAFFAAGAIMIGSKFFGSNEGATIVSVSVPGHLTPTASAGKDLFNENCASCHGPNGSGSDQGPPLVHDIYNPGHHSDEAFYRAVQQGVQQHHWPFGNMPKQAQVMPDDVAKVIQYVRELQQANGIVYRPH